MYKSTTNICWEERLQSTKKNEGSKRQRTIHLAGQTGRATSVAMAAMVCMFWRLGTLAVSAGLLFGVDLASIGAALGGMSQAGCLL